MMELKLSRRGFLKKVFSITNVVFWSTILSYFYSRYWEPQRLKVYKHTIESIKVPKSFDHTKIILFSDTHLGHEYDLDQLAALVNTINSYKPDIVLFCGDLMDAPNQYPFQDEIPPILRRIHAPLGKFAIYGNHDHGGYGSTDYLNIMDKSNFHLLMNDSKIIKSEENEEILIAGLDDYILGKPDPDKAFKHSLNNAFTILMVHEPDAAEQLTHYPISLQLSGHSHGGQVKLPFYGPLITPPGAKKYYEGFYEVGENLLPLYVNRGIGTTRLPLRFLSTPELTIFHLKRKEPHI